jgi:hypothetical protein
MAMQGHWFPFGDDRGERQMLAQAVVRRVLGGDESSGAVHDHGECQSDCTFCAAEADAHKTHACPICGDVHLPPSASSERKHDPGVVTALTEEQMVQRGGPAEVRQHARGRDGYVCRCMEVSEQLDPTTETHSAHPIPHVHDGDGFHELTKWEAAVKAVEEKEAE